MLGAMPTASDRIEDVRVAWERDLELTFAGQTSAVRLGSGDPGRNYARVRLDDSMAERVHRVAREAARRLGCDVPFTIYQTPSDHKRVNAQILLNESPFAIRLIGPIASCLDDGALAALVGHELGHWLAIGPRANPPSLVYAAQDRGACWDVYTLCILAAEFTADRFSLIAAGGELEALVRLDVAVATMDSPSALGLREIDYLDGLRRKIERGEDLLFTAGGDGYPTAAFRLHAAWLFWRSDVHHQLTGKGPGDLALRDVDVELRALADRGLPMHRTREELATRHAAARPSAEPLAVGPAAPSTSATSAADRLVDFSRSAFATGASLGGKARTTASSVASKLGRFVVGAYDAELAAVAGSASDDDEIDDLEQRFRALEGKGTSGKRTLAPQIDDDLDARFRALEDRERKPE